MKAMIVNAYGADAVFEAVEVETPEAEAGQVLVKIAASSVNTVDTMIRTMGKELPLSRFMLPSPSCQLVADRLL